MTISAWSKPFQLFTTPTGPISNVLWGRSLFSQAQQPVIIDTATAASSYVAGGLNDYSVDIAAQDWVGDEQAATLSLATTGPISLPFSFARGTTFSSANGVVNGAALWWSASATAGSYDLKFETYTDNLALVPTTTPAISPSGTIVTLESAVANPTGWTFAASPSKLVLLYGTSASSTTKNLNIQIFDASGKPLTSSAVAQASIPTSTTDSIFYSQSAGTFTLVETVTSNNAAGIEFTPIDSTSGALGAPVQQWLAQPPNTGADPIVIDSYALRPLSNGDLLEFVAWRDTNYPNYHGVTTRLLSANFADITASTPSFQSGGFENIGQEAPLHWSIAELSTGATVLVYSDNGSVYMREFDANGNAVLPIYGLLPPNDNLPPSDFDSVVAMGSRFEVIYKVSDATTGQPDEFAVIYDTATQGYAYTINDANNPGGEWVGTPFNDTITYGAGVNLIDGGGGSDTFVATNFSSSQVSVIVDAKGQVVLSDAHGDVDTLRRFSTIKLGDSTITIAGSVLTETYTDGSKSISTFNLSGSYSNDRFNYNSAGGLTTKTFNFNNLTFKPAYQAVLNSAAAEVQIIDSSAGGAVVATMAASDVAGAYDRYNVSASADGSTNLTAYTVVYHPSNAPNVFANDISHSGDVTGPYNFIDLLNLEASYSDLIHAFGTNAQAMQNWYNRQEPIEKRADTFDGLDYIASYSDLINAFKSAGSEQSVREDGALHFIANGSNEGRTTTFNGLDYIASYGDLIKAFGANGDAGAYHFIEAGSNEGRTTSFDGLTYIASYSDLIKAFGANEQAGAAHFIQNGFNEGRTTTFDGLDYIASYVDLMQAFGANKDAGATHYIDNGFGEGRTTTFDGLDYIAGYTDLMLALGANNDAGATHFINYGSAEGRNPHPFNVAAYESAHPDLIGKYANDDAFLTAYIKTYGATGKFLS